MEKDNYFFKLLFILFILGIFAYMGINDRSHKGKTFWYEVIDKRESVGSHFSIINKGVRTDYNIIFKRLITESCSHVKMWSMETIFNIS